MMLTQTIGVLLLILAVVGLATRRGRQVGHAPALLLLDTRLARGEITPDEHRQRSQTITDVATRRARGGWWWLLGGLGVALLVAGPLTTGASPGAGWWSGHPMGMAQHMGSNRTAAAPTDPSASGAPEQIVEAGDLWFAPDRVELEAGRTINLVLDNSGRVFHDLSIPDLDVHLDARPGETSSAVLRVPEAGTYEFTCTVPGHAAAGMRGELVVTASR
jgi:uncharacterized cupredoxin-like copper-binding protein